MATNVEIVKRLFELPPESEMRDLMDPEIEIYADEARRAAGLPSSSG